MTSVSPFVDGPIGEPGNRPMGKIVIDPKMVIALDAARAAAAIYVALFHVLGERLTGIWQLPFNFGQEAVIVFFLLSGFVIHANERNRVFPPYRFWGRRIRRIYPTMLAAIAVSAVVLWAQGTFEQRFKPSELIGTLLAVQDVSGLKPGVIVDSVLGNGPLWSLSYELFFYLIYPAVMWAWVRQPKLTNHLIGLVCCVSFVLYVLWPNHFALVTAYFLLWWCGAMAAEAYGRGDFRLRGVGSPLLWLVALTALAGGAIVYVGGELKASTFPFLMLRHFAVGLVMLCLAYTVLGRAAANFVAPAGKTIAWVASISYGIYVLHVPLLADWSLATDSWLGLVAAVPVLVALSVVFDRWMLKSLPRI